MSSLHSLPPLVLALGVGVPWWLPGGEGAWLAPWAAAGVGSCAAVVAGLRASSLSGHALRAVVGVSFAAAQLARTGAPGAGLSWLAWGSGAMVFGFAFPAVAASLFRPPPEACA